MTKAENDALVTMIDELDRRIDIRNNQFEGLLSAMRKIADASLAAVPVSHPQESATFAVIHGFALSAVNEATRVK